MRIDKVKFATELARADVSAKELASRTGVSRVTISAIKSGKSCAFSLPFSALQYPLPFGGT